MFEVNDCTTHTVCSTVWSILYEQYWPHKIGVYKDTVNIPAISIAYALEKPLEKDKKLE